MNGCEVPSAIVAVVGVTAIDVRAGAVTVNKEDSEIVPDVAVIEVAPSARRAASPLLFTLATVPALEVHSTEVGTSSQFRHYRFRSAAIVSRA